MERGIAISSPRWPVWLNAAALLIASYRVEQFGRTHPLRLLLGELPRDGIATRLELPALSRDAVEAMGQTRLQMSLALTSPASFRLLTIVVGWATFLFCGFGLMSRRNAMSYAALAVASLSVATTMYLIIDLSDPYSGFIQASNSPIERVMKDIVDDDK